MPPTAKEFDAIPPSSEKAAGERPGVPTAHVDDAGRPQPVALEVPVSVNGARTVEGSDKREPFSEATQTVLVFANGAVIRLASSVAPGQLLFLTNDKTKKEVVCQVVKSKNYRSVSGYVELEFTEPVAGFWGMRFPGERPAGQPGAPAAKTQAPVASGTARPVDSKPVQAPPTAIKPAQPNLTQAKPEMSAAPQAKAPTPTTSASTPKTETRPPAPVNLPRTTDTQTGTALPKTAAPSDALGIGVTRLSRTPEVKPAPPVANPPKPVTPISHGATEALKLESARLQEQLSSMLFSAPPTQKPAQLASTPPVANKAATNDAGAKVLEIPKMDPARTKTATPAKTTPVKTGSALDAEQVKIPSWLEPLARNAAVPATHDVPAKDEATQLDDSQEFEVQDVSAPPIAQETRATAPAEAMFSDRLLPEATIQPEKVSVGGNKGVMIGAIAAGVLVLVAGGAWIPPAL